MIVLLGATGYIGSAFAEVLEQKGCVYTTLSRAKLDYTRFSVLTEFLRQHKPTFLINAAGVTGKPNVDACEVARTETLNGNVLLPVTIAHACEITGTPWGHVSSGCTYNGAKVFRNGQWEIEANLASSSFQALRQEHPESILGFNETDPPNFSFSQPPCSFYSGTKALAEEALNKVGGCYIWRLRLPFDERHHALVDRLQPELGPRRSGCLPPPEVERPEAISVFLDDSVPARSRPRIDTQDFHVSTLGAESDVPPPRQTENLLWP